MGRSAAKIGTCGFGIAKEAYARAFSCVEVQQTFYQPPQLATLERWRRQMPAEFEFTLKAWQLITHEAKSPTYRRLKRELSDREKQCVGGFKASPIVNEAWKVTVACARALEARTILFQCPASFIESEENIARLKTFFSGIDRHSFNLCWEPRGPWDSVVVRSICRELDLWHAVDPFAGKTMMRGKCYFRLHGQKGWRYQYEAGELEALASMLLREKARYVFFNNSAMTEDALRFRELVG